MKKEIKIILIIIGIVLLLIIGIIIGINLSEKTKENIENKEVEQNNSIENNEITNKEEATEQKGENTTVEENVNTQESIQVTEQPVLMSVASIETDVATSLEQSLDTGLTKAKEGFIILTDFIFYGTEINGITFEQLSDNAKQSVLLTFKNLDETIKKYYPNYQEDILNLSKETSDKLFDLIEKGSTNIDLFIKENVSQET